MKEKELISMVEFVLKQDETLINPKSSTEHSDKLELSYNLIQLYAEFLNQPLNICQFVPAVFDGGKWVVLEEPKDYERYLMMESDDNWIQLFGDWYNKCRQYQQAKDNVIFEGWEMTVYVHGVWWVEKDGYCVKSDNKWTIQDLIKYKPILTKYGQQQAGL